MATNLNLEEGVKPLRGADTVPSGEEAEATESLRADDESHGYVEYLDEPEVLDAIARAKRENPGALIHIEPQIGDFWSLQVYRSEMAKEWFRLRFLYQHIALASLACRQR